MRSPRWSCLPDQGDHGDQRAATSGATDIVTVARGAGIAKSEGVRDEAHFDALSGPVLLAAKIDDQPGATQTVRDPPLIRNPLL